MRTLLLVVALTVAGLPAAAQDKCLTGSSILSDQRDLAALRDATESACPCASFSSRRDYQVCARGPLESALAAGDLRPECKRTAKKTNKGAVCGSTKVACGRFKPSASTPLSCKLKNPGKCTDTAHVDSTACPSETHCADVVDWTATTCVDVRENGPYVPGARSIAFTKPSVVTYCTGGTGNCSTMPFGAGCPCNNASACQSGVCEIQQRVLQTSIWYPAPPGSTPIDSFYGAVVDAPLDNSGGPYPLLMFSHGSCGYANQSVFLTALLASHGFIVVAPPHPGNTIFEFPNCGSPPFIAASLQERPQDVVFTLDEMLAANLDSGSPFFGAIDETRLGMSGHSFGGLTTYLVEAIDTRFKVAMPMAPAVLGSPVLNIPSLSMIGEVDSYVNNDAVRTAYANASPPKFLVEIEEAGHFAFSDGCFPSSDCNPPVTLTQDESHDAVRRYALPFLKVYLAGDSSFAPFLALPAGPSFVAEAVP